MFLFLPVASLLCTAQAAPTSAPIQERAVLVMGTRLALRLEGAPEARLRQAAQSLLAEFERIEGATSTWRPDSAWSRLNAQGGAPLALAPEWLTLLQAAQDWSTACEGAFDPVLGALCEVWGTRTGGRRPSLAERAQAQAGSGATLLQLDAAAGTAQLLSPVARLEEGGFVKGYALDAARQTAERAGARIGLLDLGGQLLVWGQALEVEVAHPRDRRRAWVRLRLENASLSSSGSAERGQHILDPRRGEPCPDWGAVSVVSARAFDADILSTALFVLGPDRGFAWASDRGIAALFLPHQGPPRMTPAFRQLNPAFLSKESQ